MSKFVLGKNGVIENIKLNKIKKIYILYNFPELDNLLKEFPHIEIEKKNKKFFLDNFNDSNHQFVVGELSTDKNHFINLNDFLNDINSNSRLNDIVVMLDEIQDPGNFGSIIRTCDALGVKGIIYKKNNQVQINNIVTKTSAGAISSISFLKTNNLLQVIENIKKQGYWIVSSSLDDDSISLNKFKNNYEKICLILGNEHKGISKLLLNNSDIKLKIPMNGICQSLNVSVSAGILLYFLSKK